MVILWEHGGNAPGTLQEQHGNGMGTSEEYYGNNMRIVLGIPWECYGNTIQLKYIMNNVGPPWE